MSPILPGGGAHAATPTLTSRLAAPSADLKARLSEVSEEAVTGRRAQLVQHLGGRIGDAMLQKAALEGLDAEAQRLDTRSLRLGLTQTALDAAREAGSGMLVEVVVAEAQGTPFELELVAGNARAALSETLSSLNTRAGARHLFSGTATDRPPFAAPDALLADIEALADAAAGDADAFRTALDAYAADPDGLEAAIYRGNAHAPDGDSVTGLDPAIRDAVAGLAAVAVMGARGQGKLAIAAAELSEQGTQGLTELQIATGRREESVETRQDALRMERAVLGEAFNALTGRDPYEAATELRQLESNLQAAYALTARLSSLNLLSFLR